MSKVKGKAVPFQAWSETVTNTGIVFYVFFRKAFLTRSYTFASICVFLLFFIYLYFRLGTNGPHSTFQVIKVIVCKIQKTQYV